MKCAGIILLASIMLPLLVKAQPGSSCASAYDLTLDGVLRSFATSTSTGASVICSQYSTTTTPITWFKFTTNGSAQCPLLSIHSPNNSECEVAMYTTCNNNSLEAASGMCFDDGEGLWAPAETFLVSANTTYYLRVKTSDPGNITISGQHKTAANDDCFGATSISTNSIIDNNSCHTGGPGVTPGQLCAFTLENTAFYQFYVASNGSAIINISNIACDNGDQNNSNGFQIGFFKGTCNALIPINCTNGNGDFVQATTEPLPAGTHVYVAIDGVSGSNCQYSIAGINVYGVMATTLKNFSAWKTGTANIIKWACENDESAYFELEQSKDGINFSIIGRIPNAGGNAPVKNYSFKDENAPPVAFYRLREIALQGYISYSHTIRTSREGVDKGKVQLINPARSGLEFDVESSAAEQLDYAVMNLFGQVYAKGTLNCTSGKNHFRKDVSSLPDGKYLMVVSDKTSKTAKPFIKMK